MPLVFSYSKYMGFSIASIEFSRAELSKSIQFIDKVWNNLSGTLFLFFLSIWLRAILMTFSKSPSEVSNPRFSSLTPNLELL